MTRCVNILLFGWLALSVFRPDSIAHAMGKAPAGVDGKTLAASSWIPSTDPNIVSLTISITQGASDDTEKSRRIFLWLAREIRYDDAVLSGRASLGQGSDPLMTLHRRRGVCGGYSSLSVALHRAAGIPARVIQGYADPNKKSGDRSPVSKDESLRHYWTEVHLEGDWRSQDPTWGSSACSSDDCRLSYFNVPQQSFANDHLKNSDVDY